MDDSETHFCKQCQNMTFLYTDEGKNLIHHCKACLYSEPYSKKNNCIYSIQFKKYDNSDYINSNYYLKEKIWLKKFFATNKSFRDFHQNINLYKKNIFFKKKIREILKDNK